MADNTINAVSKTSAERLKRVADSKRMIVSEETVREIERLREAGEYAKADDILSTVQSFLSELKSLEDWSVENSMTEPEFKKKSEEWHNAYKDAVSALFSSGERESMYAAFADDESKKTMQRAGNALLKRGIIPPPSVLASMGMDEMRAQEIISKGETEKI